MVKTYELGAHHTGWVKFDWEKDVIAVKAHYEDTAVCLKNGCWFILKGRKYGV